MRSSKPGISSYDMFAMGHTIRAELKNLGGNLFGLNSSIMKLSNGDDNSRASLDYTIGAREVTKTSSRQIGKTVSSNSGGLGPTSTPARTANLLGNPYMRRYEGPGAQGRYNFGLDGAPAIGEYYDVYESEENHLRFLDDTIGRDLFGYTHLENAASERSGEASNDLLYLRSTYSIFGDIDHPLDEQDIDVYKFGPKRYDPTSPYVLKPLESNLVRRTMNGHVQGFEEKFEAFMPGREPYRGSLLDMWDFMGSHYYMNILNGVAEHGIYVENYEMDPRNRVMVYDRDAIPQSDYSYFLNVDTISPEKEIKGLLGKTNRMFYEGKIRSLANRFATLTGHDEGRPDFLNTATDHLYGLSRGRNLRKLNLTNENGYPNPYCRVWTTHYQYSKYKHLIRGKWADDTENNGTEHYTLHQGDQLMRPNKGYERLKAMTSLDPENGRPIFAPYYVNDRSEMEKDSIKRCMFSIENLAWKDIIPDTTLIRKNEDDKGVEFQEQHNFKHDFEGSTETLRYSHSIARSHMAKGFGQTLTPEQRGPNGGRIMWFPPYNLKFNENIRAEWNPHAFIGRGEKIYSYTDTERTGTLSFTILVDHPSIVNEWARGGKMGKTGNKVSPLSQDEMILRYFAGCDSLEFNPREEYEVPYSTYTRDAVNIVIDNEDIPDPNLEDPQMNKDEKPADLGEITFYSVFYYPNNYSAADFMGQKVTKADYNGTLKNLAPDEQQITDYRAGLNEMFEKGNRQSGVGYEKGQGENNTGMTYENGYPKGAYYTGIDKNEKTVSWFYPVDTRVNNEVLRGPQSYRDEKDFGLNNTLYGTFWGDSDFETALSKGGNDLIEYLNKGNKGLEDNATDNLGLAKSLLGLKDVENKYFIPAINFFNRLSEVIKKLDATGKYEYNIDIQGYASSHGYSSEGNTKKAQLNVSASEAGTIELAKGAKSNDILAENRAAVIEGWIKALKVFDFGAGGNATITHASAGEIQNTSNIEESDFRPKAARAAKVAFTIKSKGNNITDNQKNAETPHVEKKPTTGTTITKDYLEVYDLSKSDDYENDTYDDEYAYFKQINENDDMVKRYIADKVDYFDPAFHSITPEGFNARLTFLQQCMRQGPTLSASDLGRGSSYGAGNLSFGRAPYCILRIGDFFNTKICINNIQIEYDNDGIHWDLNPEGAGLQPIMARVSIQFTFLGGNDISGPIARLQNAVSFNYYANTSIYDRRADYRNGFVTPEEDTSMTWSPLIRTNDSDSANITTHKPFSTRTAGDSEGKIKDLTKQ